MSGLRFSPNANKAQQIQWREWDGKAFLEAKLHDKPVLLSLSAVWCHWCHLMDENAYSDDEIIRLINERFIPIRVDNDRRPDINERYNMGGWPSTVFLTPDGDILTGATYMDPDQMKEMLSQVGAYYSGNKAEIQLLTAQVRARQRDKEDRASGNLSLPETVFEDIVQMAATRFDPVYGGFGMEPKFLCWETIDLLITYYRVTGNVRYLLMAAKTLDQIRSRPVSDPMEPGVFRYSMTRDWSAPHFEKMLDLNVLGLRTYSRMFQATNEQNYREAAQSMAAFLDSVLWYDHYGVFYGSQDADVRYYQLSKEERDAASKPLVDRTVYTSWNALAASVYLEASWSLRQSSFKDKALKVLDFLWQMSWDDKEGMYRYWTDGERRETGMLADQASSAKAFMDAYQVTGKRIYFERGRQITDLIMREYAAPGGGFFDIRQDDGALGNLRFRERLLEDNSLMAQVLNILYYCTQQESYKEAALSALGVFAQEYRLDGYLAAPYALAYYQCVKEPVQVIVVGAPEDPKSKELIISALQLPYPNRLVQTLDPVEQAQTLEELGYPPQPSPAAYVCYSMACSAAIQEPHLLESTVKALSKAGDIFDVSDRQP